MASSSVLNKSIAPTSILTGGVPLATGACASIDTDTPTNTVKILEAGSEGLRLSKVYSALRNTIVGTRIVLFRGSDAAGTTKRKLASKAAAAYTWSTTVEPTTAMEPAFDYSDTNPLILGPNESLWGGSTVAQTGTPIVIHAEGGKYNTP